MSMAYVAVAVSVVTAAVGATSSYIQGENAEEVADYNAKVEENKAKQAANIGADEAAAQRARARKIMSAQAEGGAMSGVDLDYGTPLGLLVETAGVGEKEAQTVMTNAQRQAWGHKAQSELDKFEGKQAKQASYLNMAGSVLSSASSSYATGKGAKLW